MSRLRRPKSVQAQRFDKPKGYPSKAAAKHRICKDELARQFWAGLQAEQHLEIPTESKDGTDGNQTV